MLFVLMEGKTKDEGRGMCNVTMTAEEKRYVQ
jgi:hypothetical protein